MGDDEVYLLRRTVTEQEQTIRRLSGEVDLLRAAIRKHRVAYGMAALVPDPVDAALWGTLDSADLLDGDR